MLWNPTAMKDTPSQVLRTGDKQYTPRVNRIVFRGSIHPPEKIFREGFNATNANRNIDGEPKPYELNRSDDIRIPYPFTSIHTQGFSRDVDVAALYPMPDLMPSIDNIIRVVAKFNQKAELAYRKRTSHHWFSDDYDYQAGAREDFVRCFRMARYEPPAYPYIRELLQQNPPLFYLMMKNSSIDTLEKELFNEARQLKKDELRKAESYIYVTQVENGVDVHAHGYSYMHEHPDEADGLRHHLFSQEIIADEVPASKVLACYKVHRDYTNSKFTQGTPLGSKPFVLSQFEGGSYTIDNIEFNEEALEQLIVSGIKEETISIYKQLLTENVGKERAMAGSSSGYTTTASNNSKASNAMPSLSAARHTTFWERRTIASVDGKNVVDTIQRVAKPSTGK